MNLAAQLDAIQSAVPQRIVGQVQGVSGLTIRAAQLPLPVGAICKIQSAGARECTAEVVGFDADVTLLMPLTNPAGINRGDSVENIGGGGRVACSSALLGRVLDGFGHAIDGKPGAAAEELRRIDGRGAAALSRVNIRQPIATGIRAIDALHTCGRGQRMGIFSAPGVGKSTLISSIARHTDAEIGVVALIGERAREVQEFLHTTLGPEGLKRCVVIVAESSEPPLMRVRAAKVAATIAEYFRDQGKHVLLLMDSLTRLCQAQRQIGLAAGELPATRGFPPSAFAILPEILERAGNTAGGSITGFYTVLVEGDDFNEPIADAVKSVTDGHVWLSATLASRGHFPAIDVLQSISRVREAVIDDEHLQHARRLLSVLAVYREIEDLVSVGAYVAGANADRDLAVKARPLIEQFLRQEISASVPLNESRRALAKLCVDIDAIDKPRQKPKVKLYRPPMRTPRHV